MGYMGGKGGVTSSNLKKSVLQLLDEWECEAVNDEEKWGNDLMEMNLMSKWEFDAFLGKWRKFGERNLMMESEGDAARAVSKIKNRSKVVGELMMKSGHGK